ncbi:MAG: hypothetical protein K1X33_09320 [Methanobacteriaceae archaeon]|nr:hypothetical protein [Methanobacteriaceae archaeon]
MNKLIKVEELQEGDEIIVSGLDLKYLKVLKPVSISDKKCWIRSINPLTGKFEWLEEEKKYKAVRCSIRQDKIPYVTNSGIEGIYKETVFEQNITKHNHKISIDLSGKNIFLVKREEPKKQGIYE